MDDPTHRSEPGETQARLTHAERTAAARRQRESAALRDNLARRKAQSRERRAGDEPARPDTSQDDAACR